MAADTATLQRLLADARVDAKVQKDMVERASAEANTLRADLERVQGQLKREAALRAEAERQVSAREADLRDYQAKVEHHRKMLSTHEASRKTDSAKMDYAVAEARAEAEAEASKLQDQIRALRRQLSDVQAQAEMDKDLARSAISEELKEQWEAKVAKAVAAAERKGAVALQMLKEDYDQLVDQNADLQKQMRARIRDVEQSASANNAEGANAITQLKRIEERERRVQVELATARVDLSAAQAALDSANARAKAKCEELEDEVRRLSEELSERQVDLAAARVELKTTKKKLKTSKEKQKDAKAQCDAATVALDDLRPKHASLQKEAATLEADRDFQRQQREAAELERDRLSRELKDRDSSLAAAQRQLDKLIPEKEHLEVELKVAKATVADLTAQVDRSLAEIRSATFQNESVISQLEALLAVVVEIGGKAAGGSPAKPKRAGAAAVAAGDSDDDDDDDVALGFGDDEPGKEKGGASAPAGPSETAAAVTSAIEAFRARLSDVQLATSRLTSSGSAAASANADRVVAVEELAELKAVHETQTAELKRVRRELEQLTATHVDKVKESEDLLSQSADLVGQIGARTHELDVSRELVEDLNERLAAAESELNELRCDTEALEKRLEETTAALESTEEEQAKTVAEMAEVESQLAAIGTTASSAVEKLSAARAKLKQTEAALAAAEAAKSETAAALEQLQAEHAKATAEVERLHEVDTELEESQQFVRQLTEQLNDSEDKRERLEAAMAAAKEEVSRATAVADSKDKVMVANTEAFMKQSAYLDDHKQRSAAAEAELARVSDAHSKLQLRLAAVEAARDELKASLATASAELADERATVQALRSRLAESEQKFVAEASVSSRLTNRLGEVESKLSEANARAAALEGDRDVVAADSRGKLADTQRERDDLKKEATELKGQLSSAQERLAAAERLVSAISVEKLRAQKEARELAKRLGGGAADGGAGGGGGGGTEPAGGGLGGKADERISGLEAQIATLERQKMSADELVKKISLEKIKLQSEVDSLREQGGGGAATVEEVAGVIARVLGAVGCDVRTSTAYREDEGMPLGLELRGDIGRTTVTAVEPGSPFAGSEVREGDAVVSINGTFVLDLVYEDVVGALLSGGKSIVVQTTTIDVFDLVDT